ncbi:MAG: hypothetical protein ED556_13880 [Winogradskyella sp.]|uniref:DUF6607 family protein n=1 Tax=Winogradskyella sp. TaxID=1883156 RepID=UPI000F40AA26|nr:DUF6607 family protein [Winogradskyella sp.]RNC80189.1 MAG: hypothetical protein ED556_13880 [Winogradskyella sp.]
MKSTLSFLVILTFGTFITHGQKKLKQDRAAIKEMCGCFEIKFNFAETFSYNQDSLYRPSKIYQTKGLEWGQLVVDEKNKVSIQHILQAGPHIIKHWRQDWLYENTDLYTYNGDNEWLFETKSKSDVDGQWTQKVFQVDDSPRYEGSGTWIHIDGKSYWENTTTAPLPRREYTKRSDYNITLRGNRHEITDYGWVHDQDNKKVVRESGKEDIVIADEKGYSTYKKVDDSKCQAAQDWWKKHYDKWEIVRTKWDDVYGRKQTLSLESKVDNKVLYKYLFDDEMVDATEINDVIESFVKK